MELRGVEWSTYRADRAEALVRDGRRPDDARTLHEQNVITAWPTKLALAPQLASIIVMTIGEPRQGSAAIDVGDWPRPIIAAYPWETSREWFAGD
jgi:hypothetical protein